MANGRLQVIIKDGVLIKTIEINTGNDSLPPIDYIVPDGVIKIGIGAFHHCTSLKSVVIPKSVTLIDFSAFSCCYNLESITIPDSVLIRPYISKWSGNWSMFTFYQCDKLKDIYINISNLSAYLTKNWEYRNVETFGMHMIGCNRNKHMLINGEEVTDLVIPSDVARIGDSALHGYSHISSIVIPNGVVSIGRNAFNRCSRLKSITIPDSVKSIGSGAFWNCPELESVYFKHTLPLDAGSIGLAPTKLYHNGKTTLLEHFWNGGSNFPRIYVPQQSVELYKIGRAHV